MFSFISSLKSYDAHLCSFKFVTLRLQDLLGVIKQSKKVPALRL